MPQQITKLFMCNNILQILKIIQKNAVKNGFNTTSVVAKVYQHYFGGYKCDP